MVQAAANALMWSPLISFVAIGGLFVVPAWLVIRRRGAFGAYLLVGLAAVPLAYLWYRGTCARPLTCDVGGRDYASVLIPRFLTLWLIVLGSVSAFTAVMVRRTNRPLPSGWHPLAGGLIAVLGLVPAEPIVGLWEYVLPW